MDAADLKAYLPDDADYAISEEEQFRLWRAYHAAALLAALNNEVAVGAGISQDGPAAVAEYIRQDLLDVLGAAQRLREPDAGSPTTGADLI